MPSRGEPVTGSEVLREPEAAAIEAQGFGWPNRFGTGSGAATITSGLEGAWTTAPATWDNGFLDSLYTYDWELTTSPAGARQWTPTNAAAVDTVPDAHDPATRHAPSGSRAITAVSTAAALRSKALSKTRRTY